MSDKQLAWLSLGIGAITLVMTFKMAMALTDLQNQVNNSVEGVKSGPAGGLLHAFGVV